LINLSNSAEKKKPPFITTITTRLFDFDISERFNNLAIFWQFDVISE
jgi:hypothetical protein